jgi:hypothetical protein
VVLAQLEVVFALLQHHDLVSLLLPVEGFLLQLLLQRQLQLLVLNGFATEGHAFLALEHFGADAVEETALGRLFGVREGTEVQG